MRSFFQAGAGAFARSGARACSPRAAFRRASLLAGLLALLLWGGAGCAGYRLGPSNGLVAGARSLQIRPFVNQTIEPRLGEALTAALRKQVQQDGTYRLNTAGLADYIVNGAITKYQRSELSFEPRDVITVRDYTLTLTARLTAVERGSGRVVLDKTVTGRTTLHVGSDLGSGERQALPLLAEDWARNATSLLVDGAW